MIEEKICPKCGEPYEGSLMEHLMKTRHNKTVEDLKRRLAESADREQSLVLQLVEAEKERDTFKEQLDHELTERVETAITCVECANIHDNDSKAYTAQLHAASELAEKWKEEARGYKDGYGKFRNRALETYARELEVALGIEASISKHKERRDEK